MAETPAEQSEDRGEWQVLDGIDPAGTAFPVDATLADEAILVFKTASGFRGVQPLCPHQGVSLKEAALMNNDSMIRCPRHNFIFRLDDGAGVNCRGITMKTYAVRENAGRLEGLVPA